MRDALAQFPHIWLTCIGLILFLSVFLGSILWVFRPKTEKLYTYVADIPFQGDPL